MSEDYSLFPKLNPLPAAENAQDSKGTPGREARRKRKERNKGRPGNEPVPEGEGKDPEGSPDQRPVGKVLDITI